MQITCRQFLLGISVIPSIAALQTIYFGEIGSSAGPSNCIAFFSDSDPCNDGVLFGGVYCSGSFCNEDITILGHQNISFTGCHTHKTNTVTEQIPSGVSDNGTPALKCNPASNPPGSEYGVFAVCEGGDTSKNGGYVNVDSYCS